IAIAGRSRAKLDAVAAELGGAAASWPRLLVDVSDPAACADLAGATRILVTTVGPYALHGRELVKARAMARTHYADHTGEGLLVASHPAACADLAGATRILVTTVGPYALHGRELVKACAMAGIHYADLTGEVLFVRDTSEAFHDVARRSGARIVHSCGFDSVP